VRQSEELGEIDETAINMVRTTMEARKAQETELLIETTPVRAPASQRLGPASEPLSAFDRLGPIEHTPGRELNVRSVQPIQKRRTVRVLPKRNTPLSLGLQSVGV
ncbi:unnamed protein product, partial [Brassica napus]